MGEVTFDEASSYWLILEDHSGVMDGFRPAERVVGGAGISEVAIGHLINHPPDGIMPNVTWQEFEWSKNDDDTSKLAVNRLHRGLWYLDPNSMEPVDMPCEDSPLQLPLPGVAIVALRDLLPGEELFMNSKLSRPHPAWYTPVSAN